MESSSERDKSRSTACASNDRLSRRLWLPSCSAQDELDHKDDEDDGDHVELVLVT